MPDSRWKLISIRTLRGEGDLRRKSRSNLWSIFLSTPSARRATERPIRQALELSISIHALREEGDDRGTAPSGSRRYFYPRPLRGGRQHAACGDHAVGLFLSTPSARRATAPAESGMGLRAVFLSTPSARRATRASLEPHDALTRFLSTPSARRATWAFSMAFFHAGNFYPRPPRGGRRCFLSCGPSLSQFLSTPSARRATLCAGVCGVGEAISIHALREEGDLLLGRRLLLGRISIHALREEGDTSKRRRSRTTCNFYPRPPRGGRQSPCVAFCVFRIFLSTPSARRATDFLLQLGICLLISIHALREEGDFVVFNAL